MKRLSIALSLLSLLTFSTTAVEANDIEDFFKAAFRGPNYGHDGHAHGRDRFRQSAYRGGHDSHSHGRSRFDDRGYDRRRFPARNSSFHLSIGLNNSRLGVGRSSRAAVGPTGPLVVTPRPILEAPAPIVLPVPHPGFRGPRLPAPPVPVLPVPRVNGPALPGPAVLDPHTRFDYGELIECEVPLFTRVRVKDRDNIHPRSVDLVIAVKDPNTCERSCTCCEKRSVFVPICVPPCSPERIKVSRDGSRIELDYGDYEVDISSRRGLVTVDYDD